MKKLTFILLFSSVFGHAQIDYKALVRNLEDVTLETDLKTYFKDLPVDAYDGEVEFNDERFLRFYGVILKHVKIGNDWEGRRMILTPYNEKADYKKIVKKLNDIYGEAQLNDRGNSIRYLWEGDTKSISLSVEFVWENDDEDMLLIDHLDSAEFESFDNISIYYKK